MSICKAHKQADAYQGIWWLMQKQIPGTWAKLSTSRLWAAAAVQGVVIWDSEYSLRSRDAFQVLLLPHVYLPSAKQAGSSQHSNF